MLKTQTSARTDALHFTTFTSDLVPLGRALAEGQAFWSVDVVQHTWGRWLAVHVRAYEVTQRLVVVRDRLVDLDVHVLEVEPRETTR